jgi:hypothetical protein
MRRRTYDPWVGKLEDGTEILVTVYNENGPDENPSSVSVAYRGVGDRCWGPPIEMEAAP